MDFSLQKKSKIPKSYNDHRTKLLSSDQLHLKERKKERKPNLKQPNNKPQSTTTTTKKTTPKNIKPPKTPQTISFEDST